MNTQQSIAYTLGATPEVMPYLGRLLADLQALGSSPSLIVDLLRPLGLPPDSRVLDLGCGKGAVALEIAQRLGFQVEGVDGFRPFIQAARRRAKRLRLSGLCRFECADLRDVFRRPETYDVIVLAAIGPVLGDMAQTVGTLRQRVRPGGYLVLDDGFLDPGEGTVPDSYTAYLPYRETVAQMTSFGDRVIHERIFSPDEIRATNAAIYAKIRRRAASIIRRHPAAAEAIQEYLRGQEDENLALETRVRSALWVVKIK
ncbi:MAG: class I SAM-dependent methyltransferase [Candidatus Zixiibacteriota bacterium]|nr:MAG: class I SAM-dependent methyltransferase [candidate division Zixibacteria bacterium]